jgi:hypothetical protein
MERRDIHGQGRLVIELRIRGTEQLDDLAARLADAPRRLRNELRSGLSAAARPTVQDVRREIRSVSMSQRKTWAARSARSAGGRLGSGSSPLRPAIASAVNVRALANADGASVEIYLTESQVPARARWLVPYIVGRKKRLRHPFMGNRRRWVAATGDLDVWWPTIRRHMTRFAAARDEAVSRTEQSLEG